MRVLVTGAAGFAGSWLIDYLLTLKNIKIFAIDKNSSKTDNLKHIKNKIKFYKCDLKDIETVRDILEKVKPDRIFHLAAQSFLSSSWQTPIETIENNILGEINIFEVIRALKLNPLIQIAGSSEEYGFVEKSELPVKETNILRPLSPYAVSKVTQDLLGYQYFMNYGLKIIRTRAFNHTGPRRPPNFVCSELAYQIVKAEKGLINEICVGNLDIVRDFTDVRDTVRGYWLALEKGKPGEVYNICSGKGHKIKDVLYTLLELSGVKAKIKQDPAKTRPSDVPVLIGDATKLKNATGWKPQIPFEQTLKDILDFWRKSII